jgi:hypothetical protein
LYESGSLMADFPDSEYHLAEQCVGSPFFWDPALEWLT